MTLTNTYGKMLENFGGQREQVAVNYSCIFANALDCANQAIDLYQTTKNPILEKRLNDEIHYHTYLINKLFARLQEIKYYSKVDILDTRRMLSTSDDCISAIQILVRDRIHLNVYFRSSDFDGALPVDLKSLCTLPLELIKHLDRLRNTIGYDEVNDELITLLSSKKVQLNMMFGSLHRTK